MNRFKYDFYYCVNNRSNSALLLFILSFLSHIHSKCDIKNNKIEKNPLLQNCTNCIQLKNAALKLL